MRMKPVAETSVGNRQRVAGRNVFRKIRKDPGRRAEKKNSQREMKSKETFTRKPGLQEQFEVLVRSHGKVRQLQFVVAVVAQTSVCDS